MLGDYADIAVKLAKEAERKPKPKQTRDTGSSFFTKVRELARDEPAPPKGPPNPTLQKYGFHGTTQEFNGRVEVVVTEYQKIKGIDPSPGLVFDVARSQAPTETIPDLFGPLAFTKRAAQAAGLGGKVGAVAPSAANVGPAAVPKLEAVTAEEAQIHARGDLTPEQTRELGLQIAIDRTLTPKLEQLGFSNVLKAIPATLGTPLTQVGSALAGAPFGFYLLGRAIWLDSKEVVTEGDFTPERVIGFGGAVAAGFKETYSDPLHNTGYIFLDLLGLSGVIGGTAARAGRAGATLKAGSGLGAAARELVTRRPTGTVTLRVGDLEAERVLIDNPTVALAQRYIAEVLNKRVAARQNALVPGSQNQASVAAEAGRLLDKHLSAEAKFGRVATAERRVEHQLLFAIKAELDRVAGRSFVASRAFGYLARKMGVEDKVSGKLPAKARRSLTRGEQKAIQVLATDDPAPFATWRAFHERMIDQADGWSSALGIERDVFVANHQRHLADLKLAEQAVENRSPRFEKALALTREVVEDMQTIKIQELGLSPITAATRVVSVPKVLKEGRPAVGGEPQYGGFYLPFVSKARTRPSPGQIAEPFATRRGPYGIPMPRDMPELNHVFTGQSIIAGDFRIDATALVGEAYARTVRTASIWRNYRELQKASKPTRTSEWDIPIRDTAKIPDELRERLLRIDEGEFTAADAASLAKDDVDTIIRHLFPDPKDKIEGVRWVDSRIQQRMMGGLAFDTGVVAKVGQRVNEPFRLAILYLRPAYALNLVGNTAMGVIQQGPFLVPNVARGLWASKLYGPRVAHAMDAITGSSRSRSYVNFEVESNFLKGGRALAQGWNKVADQYFRRGALIYELRRQGIRTADDMRKALLTKGQPLDKRVVEAKLRGNKAMVEFDNLAIFEKSVLRNMIFVYPWVSRSAVWSIRTMFEHPVQTEVYSLLGREADDELDEVLGKVPEYIKRLGYFPVSWEGANPKVVSGRGVWTFSTFNELLTLESASELFGPAAEIGLHIATGRDRFGREYPGGIGGDIQGALVDQVKGLPQVAAVGRAKPNKPGEKPSERPTFIPGLEAAFGPLIASSFWPRTLDLEAAEERYWNKQPREKQVRHRSDLIQKAEEANAKALGRRLPPEVQAVLDLRAERDLAYVLFEKNSGRSLDGATAQRRTLDIDLLLAGGRIDQAEAGRLKRELAKAAETSEEELERFSSALLRDHLGGRELSEWHSDANTVLSFDKTYGVEYGRRFLAYQKKAREITDRAFATGDKREQQRVFAEAALLESETDKPVVIDGKSYPSIVRESWKRTPPQDKERILARKAGLPWTFLSSLDKELLTGRKTPEGVAEGWLWYRETIEQYQLSAPPGKRSLTADQRAGLAKQIDKARPGFYKDFLVSEQPRYQRLAVSKTVVESANKAEWEYLFANANKLYVASKEGRFSSQTANDAWADYVKQYREWVRMEFPAFDRELKVYEESNASFLYDLLRK